MGRSQRASESAHGLCRRGPEARRVRNAHTLRRIYYSGRKEDGDRHERLSGQYIVKCQFQVDNWEFVMFDGLMVYIFLGETTIENTTKRRRSTVGSDPVCFRDRSRVLFTVFAQSPIRLARKTNATFLTS